MLVINFFGGPGSGKSTQSAGLFHMMKLHGHNCEYVTEFAKDLVWEGNLKPLTNQNYIFASQEQKLSRLKDVVDYAITDSPLLLSLIYKDNNYFQEFENFVRAVNNSYRNCNVFIKRHENYSQVGRLQNIEEALEIDKKIMDLVDFNIIVESKDQAFQKIYNHLF